MALLCFHHVRVGLHESCKRVSRAWRDAFSSAELHALRERGGVKEPWLYLRAGAQQHGKAFEWLALDEETGWHAVRPPPCEAHNRASGVGCVALRGCLYSIGGIPREGREALSCVYR